MSRLSEVLRESNVSGLSARGVARAARERGYSLNHDTAARYLRGDHGRPDEATLVAFADVLGVDLAVLRTAADLPAELTAPYTPPPEASRLNRRQRLAVDEIIRAMLDTTSSSHSGDELAQHRRRPTPRAARFGTPDKPEN
ncbi:helix-turn-helix domain-containing protein [Jatrophihabitans sp.]|uniref:helix-turn-helix domain-containing protein n=1 Tax=Jatrophihabitans sp. TaxID=1932789 RepID=UPI0030C77146|nr:hypothetical protein [Jatrophihabitans sp.]